MLNTMIFPCIFAADKVKSFSTHTQHSHYGC